VFAYVAYSKSGTVKAERRALTILLELDGATHPQHQNQPNQSPRDQSACSPPARWVELN